MTEREVFTAALAKGDPAERAAYLDEVCRGDAPLRQRVESLLADHAQLGSFLDLKSPEATVEHPLECPGTPIGPYKLLQQIGEGGMGVVYMAEQLAPVKRRVALKIIKPGMDTRQVIARFEAERQALSLMDHPNIAKVLDAGTTSSGRPYFVMELVKGQPITQYCDEHHLTPRQRLELLLPVCQAIQHAHQKGIIHRDIKPTNILVAEYDQQPVPKVIDFGVAKATSQTLTEKTMFTGFGQIVGTLEYMSPEQAKVNQLDIDTRSDIYSLGVLLYELLTGSTPFDKQRLRSAGWDEMLRIIREEEPEKPSTRLSDLSRVGSAHQPAAPASVSVNSGEYHPPYTSLASIAALRLTEPAKLTRLVRGELDWIVMKALEKDRGRRYETASGLAADIQHYLNDEAVVAGPPSALYRFRKFARRNRAALTMALVIGVALLLAVGTFGWAVRDRVARQAKVAGQVEVILSEVDGLEKEQKWPEALAAARRAEAAVTGGEAGTATAQRVRERLKDLLFLDRLEQIRMQRAEWVEGKFDDAGADQEYTRAFRDYGVDVEALAAETSVDRLRARPALAIPLAAALYDWLQAQWISKTDVAGRKRLVAVARGIDSDPLRDRLRSTWGKPASEVGDELHRLADSIDIRAQHPATVVSLARSLHRAKHSDSALRLLRSAHYDYPGDFWLNFTLASVLSDQQDPEGAIRYYTAAVSIRPNTVAHSNLGSALRKHRKLDEATAAFRKAIELDPKYDSPYINLGTLLCDDLKDYDKAIDCFRMGIELDPKNARAHYNLGIALHGQKKLDEAIDAYRKAIELDPQFAKAYSNLGTILCDNLNDYDKAIDCFRKVIELDPKNAMAHNNVGVALRGQKKLDEATAAFRKAIELDPQFAKAHNYLGNALRDQKKLDEAIDAYRKAIELDPKYVLTHCHLGNALRAQKKLDEAIDAFRKAIELNPKFAGTYNSLGALLCDNLNDYDKAIDCFRKAIELDPKNAQAYGNLRIALEKKGWHLINSSEPKHRDPKGALEAIKEAIELAPQSELDWQYLGWVQYRIGNWRASIEALEKSCKLHTRGTGDSGQWIVLALAHARLSAQEDLPEKEWEHHSTEARRWFDRADTRWPRPTEAVSQARWDFREEARELLGVKEKKN